MCAGAQQLTDMGNVGNHIRFKVTARHQAGQRSQARHRARHFRRV